MRKILKLLDEIEEKVLVYSFFASVLIIFLQVVMRKVFNNSLFWTEEVARYLFVWQCWLGVSIAEREKQHIRITVLRDKLPNRGKISLELCVNFVLVVLAIMLIINGFMMVMRLAEMGSTSTAVNIPMSIVYAALPTGCLLYLRRLIENIINVIRRGEVIE
ncbi:MAG: TRAP transporter small permease [Lentihominibacter sp.]|jgi:TRAP-type C4-dicarboxylate transport system permease small subunit